ncbi:unnamed protein product [Cunninghamella blakesleeana]
MLRVYSILQLEPLWLKPRLDCELLVQDESIEPVQVVEQTEVLVEEPESLEVAEPEYQEVVEEEQIVIHKVDTSVSQDSVQVIELELDDNNNEEEEEKNDGNISSSSSSSSSSEEDNIEEKYVKEKVQDKHDKKDVAPITTTDLKSISEEPNDSSNISSSSSSPETPTSAQSPKPRTRLRKDSKFNERRKSMTNKLKRAFSSASSSSSKRNSIIST